MQISFSAESLDFSPVSKCKGMFSGISNESSFQNLQGELASADLTFHGYGLNVIRISIFWKRSEKVVFVDSMLLLVKVLTLI